MNIAILHLFIYSHGAERYKMRGIVLYFVIAVVMPRSGLRIICVLVAL
ncbi:MAG: hypothetical protein VCB07_00445 [Gammaproteobacteria bacterium]